MKAKLRKVKKLKNSNSNIQSSLDENKSQEIPKMILSNNPSNLNKNLINSKSVEVPNKLLQTEEIRSSNVKMPINPVSMEDNKEQELSRLATMFNFEIDKKKAFIKIQENDEYYDMRNQILKLEEELENAKIEYHDLLTQYKDNNESEKQEIGKLENELKALVENDIEKIKNENNVLIRDINLLEKKVDSLYALNQQEQSDMSYTIIELDNAIKKLKGEIYFVDDLKCRIKNMTNKDLPQDLVQSINNILRNNSVDKLTPSHTHSHFGSVKSKTGEIPINNILDTSSFESEKSTKKLFI